MAIRMDSLVLATSSATVAPLEHGRRLATIFRDARLVEIEDSYTLIPEDQPERFAAELAAVVTESARDAAAVAAPS